VSIVSIKRMTRTHDGNRAPGAATPRYRSKQHVSLNGKMCVADIARQDVEIPVGLLWQGEEKFGCLTPWTELGDAAVSGLKEVARVAKGVTQSLVRLTDISQMRG
jgi:hypothetical protein